MGGINLKALIDKEVRRIGRQTETDEASIFRISRAIIDADGFQKHYSFTEDTPKTLLDVHYRGNSVGSISANGGTFTLRSTTCTTEHEGVDETLRAFAKLAARAIDDYNRKNPRT